MPPPLTGAPGKVQPCRREEEVRGDKSVLAFFSNFPWSGPVPVRSLLLLSLRSKGTRTRDKARHGAAPVRADVRRPRRQRCCRRGWCPQSRRSAAWGRWRWPSGKERGCRCENRVCVCVCVCVCVRAVAKVPGRAGWQAQVVLSQHTATSAARRTARVATCMVGSARASERGRESARGTAGGTGGVSAGGERGRALHRGERRQGRGGRERGEGLSGEPLS